MNSIKFFLSFSMLITIISIVEAAEWKTAPSIDVGVSNHTATLLPDSRIILCGGKSDKKITNGVRIFTPHDNGGLGIMMDTMLKARVGHTATLLSNGMLLIIGGYGEAQGSGKACELYNPYTGEFVFLSNQLKNSPRYFHVATLLPNGTVLVSGGGSDLLEIYDPALNEFCWNRKLEIILDRHTASLLTRGKVILAGGGLTHLMEFQTASGVLKKLDVPFDYKEHQAITLRDDRIMFYTADNQVLLFNYDSQKITKVGQVDAPLTDCSISLLPDENVVILGEDTLKAKNRAFLFNPGNNAIEELSSPKISRKGAGVVMLPDGQLFVCGGREQSEIEVLEPSTGKPLQSASMIEKRKSHTATLLPDGNVLVVGGFNGRYLQSCERFDYRLGRFEKLQAQLKSARHCHSATLLQNGTLLIAGGYNSDHPNYLASSELYDLETQRFYNGPDLMVAREKQTATLLDDGTVLICGGFQNYKKQLKSAELYIPARQAPSMNEDFKGAFKLLKNNMHFQREKHTATKLRNGHVLIVGGLGPDGPVAYAELYDPETKAFKKIDSPLSKARYQHTATMLQNGNVLIVGGRLSEATLAGSIELFSMKEKKFKKIDDPEEQITQLKWMGHSATLLPDGRVMIIGGDKKGIGVYYPTTNEFKFEHSLVQPRLEHTSTMLPNGRILVAGGSNYESFLNSTETVYFSEYEPEIKPEIDEVRWNPKNMKAIIKGKGFISPIGSGGQRNASARFPKVTLMPLESGGMNAYGASGEYIDLTPTLFPLNWLKAHSQLEVTLPDRLKTGYWMIYVISGGRTSDGYIINNFSPKALGKQKEFIIKSKNEKDSQIGWQAKWHGNDKSGWKWENLEVVFKEKTLFLRRINDAEWGSIRTPVIKTDISVFSRIEVKLKEISPDTHWNIAYVPAYGNKHIDFNSSTTLKDSIVDAIGNTILPEDRPAFHIQLNIEADVSKRLEVESMHIIHPNN